MMNNTQTGTMNIELDSYIGSLEEELASERFLEAVKDAAEFDTEAE